MCCYLSLFATEIWAAWVPVTFFTACKKEATEGEQYGHCSDGITEIKIVLKDGIFFWGHLINITTATTGLAKPHPLVPTTVCYDPNENPTRTTMKLDEHCASQCTISAVRLNDFKLKIVRTATYIKYERAVFEHVVLTTAISTPDLGSLQQESSLYQRHSIVQPARSISQNPSD